jgi:hypothetical protein
MLANSKLARQISSRAFNPTYTFTSTNEAFSLGEVAAPIVAFGDIKAGTVQRDLVEYFFGTLSPVAPFVLNFLLTAGILVNERFPEALGWLTREEVVTVKDIVRLSSMIEQATNLLTDSQSAADGRRDVHGGIGDAASQQFL